MNVTRLARAFMRLHNEASVEFRAAFAAAGAQMWHDDYAHAIPAACLGFIEETMGSLATDDDIRAVYAIACPLTVLDGYPDVAAAKRSQLKRKVDEISAQYQADWDREISQSPTKRRAHHVAGTESSDHER